MIDASQSLGAMPLDVGRLDPDFVVSVGYKWLLGPLGLGPLYVAERHRGGGRSRRAGSTGPGRRTSPLSSTTPIATSRARAASTWASAATSAWCRWRSPRSEQLLEWRVEAVALGLADLTANIATRMGRLGVDVIPEGERGPHILGIELPGNATASAVEAMRERGVAASVRGRSLRIAPHLHVRESDVDRLVDAIAAAL